VKMSFYRIPQLCRIVRRLEWGQPFWAAAVLPRGVLGVAEKAAEARAV
jgi:hypothetical protein